MTNHTEESYRKRATETLSRLLDRLDELSQQFGDSFEVELFNDILTIEFRDGVKFVVNSHRAAQQIWMAANTSAWHFNPAPGNAWVCSKSGATLDAVLTHQLEAKLGRAVDLNGT